MNKLLASIFVIILLAMAGNNSYANSFTPAGLDFDGLDDVVLVPHFKAMETNAITAEAWVKVDAMTSEKFGNNEIRQFILFKKNNLDHSNEAFALYLDQDKKCFWLTLSSKDGFQKHISTEPGTAVVGKWTHLAFTADNHKAELYIDGALAAEGETGFDIDLDNEPLFIGDRETAEYSELSYGGHFNGQIDEVKIWNTIRSQQDIAATHASYMSGNEDNLVLYLPFNEGKGTVSADKTENGKAALINNPRWVETDEDSDNIEIRVSPNPAKDKASLELTLDKPANIEINIFNIAGEKMMNVFSGDATAGFSNYSINLSNLRDGAYICEINYNGTKKSTRLIKVK